MSGTPTRSRSEVAIEIVIVLGIASFLTALFWWPLPVRGGFIGGDTYNYFFPLRDFYQQGLKQGELRLWHPGIGNGVPILGESQTGLFYPFYLLAYRWLDLNTAYSMVFLGHYIFAYLATYFLARQLRASSIASHLSAIVFVFGWFPPRACLEWAIVTGAWLPAILALAISFLWTGRFLSWVAISIAVALQLLAGHFNLAWITLLATICLLLFPTSLLFAEKNSVPVRRRLLGVGAIAFGFLLAAPQLLPAWELKQLSQRSSADFLEEISRGNVPPAYFARSQWPLDFLRDRDEVLAELQTPTNKVEAHLYLGPIALLLVVCSLIHPASRRFSLPWIAMALLMFLLATGLIIAPLASLPGFSFFRYCGRYGVVTQLGIAIVFGLGVSAWRLRSLLIRVLIPSLLGGAIFAEYFFVGHQVQYVTIVEPPIITLRDQSDFFRVLQPTDRVLAIDGNTLALSGAACVPPYLGMGPAEYYQIWEAFPNVFTGTVPFGESIARTFRTMGVSHLLTLAPLPTNWPVELLVSGYDPFLHRRWGRSPDEPLYLYRYQPHPGRAYRKSIDQDALADGPAIIRVWSNHAITVETDGSTPADLVLSDLLFPGWSVCVDGKETMPQPTTSVGRIVRVDGGKHLVEWSYRPRSLWIGLLVAIFGAGMIGITGISWSRISRIDRSASANPPTPSVDTIRA
jgi:hypothetical protein